MQVNTLLLLLSLALVPLSGCLGFGNEEEPNAHEECPTGDHMEHGDEAVEHADEAMESNETEAPLNATFVKSAALQPGNETGNGTAPEAMADGNETVEDDHSEHEHDECPTDGIVDGNTTIDPSTPNELPIPALTMTADDGTVLDGTNAILPGQTITFNAADSSDPDGTVDLVGLVVKDANGTRNAQLMVDGVFTDATMQFDHVGPVNVTLRVLDNRGEGVVLNTMAFVNGVFTGSQTMTLFDPTGSGCSATGTSQGLPLLVTQQYFHKETFNVAAGAKWISAESSGTSGDAICYEDGTAYTVGDALEPSTRNYLGLHPSGPETTVSWTITVHYEPVPAEA